MCSDKFPAHGTPERRFLDVMLTGTMAHHPEYVQEAGNARILALAGALLGLGWDVKMKALLSPMPENPNRYVVFCYIDEHTLLAAVGEGIDA